MKTLPQSHKEFTSFCSGVENVELSSNFYDALGWKRAQDSHAGFVKYDLGGIAIALISKHDFANDALYDHANRTGFPSFALIYLVKSAEEVPLILQKAVDAGGELVKPATRTPFGVAGYFRDPDGHLFEVDYEEKFEFTEDYRLITGIVSFYLPPFDHMDALRPHPGMQLQGKTSPIDQIIFSLFRTIGLRPKRARL